MENWLIEKRKKKLTTKDGLEIKIQYYDEISFTIDESIKIKTIQEENAELNKSKVSINLDIRIFDLNYLPKFTYQSCSFLEASFASIKGLWKEEL